VRSRIERETGQSRGDKTGKKGNERITDAVQRDERYRVKMKMVEKGDSRESSRDP
jgi:hypothetical protein